jgi:hypothetical protein
MITFTFNGDVSMAQQQRVTGDTYMHHNISTITAVVGNFVSQYKSTPSTQPCTLKDVTLTILMDDSP